MNLLVNPADHPARSHPGLVPSGLLFERLRRELSAEALVRQHEPLARRTTLRVGGPADLFVEPADETDLSRLVRACSEAAVPLRMLGRGSNLLVRDGGVRGAVCSLNHPAFMGITADGERLDCAAGARLKAVSVEAKRHNLAGLEFLEGIPGSVGGALRMNAGAMGQAFFQVVERVRSMDGNGQVHEFAAGELRVQYRSCPFFLQHIALGAVVAGQPAPREQIETRLLEYSRKRWKSQPAAPSAGCIFKNPPTVPAGKLIEELGLKGTRVGGAEISMVHGNFIVNTGAAKARDVLELIDLVRDAALRQRGIQLETEVEIIGENAEVA